MPRLFYALRFGEKEYHAVAFTIDNLETLFAWVDAWKLCANQRGELLEQLFKKGSVVDTP